MSQHQIDSIIFALSSAASVFFLSFAVYFTFMEIRYKRSVYQACANQLGLFKREVLALQDLSGHSAVVSSPFAARHILSSSEKQFLQMLLKSLPDCLVFPQVSINALMDPAPQMCSRRKERALRRRFNTRYVDFVVCDKTNMEVKAIAEFDGGDHPHLDARRDELLKSVGYRVEHFSDHDTVESVKARLSGTSHPEMRVYA